MTEYEPKSIWKETLGLFEALGDAISKKWSARKTAENLSDIFGITLTRNAVISKAHRSGLPSFHSGEDGQYARKPKHTRKKLLYTAYYPLPKRTPLPLVETTEAPVLQGFLGLTIQEIGDNQCRYPHGDRAPYAFCGQPVQGESSWCPYHFTIVSQPKNQKVSNELHRATQGGPLSHGFRSSGRSA